MRFLSLLFAIVLASCTKGAKSKSFSSVDEAKATLEEIVATGNSERLTAYVDFSGAPERILKVYESTIVAFSKQVKQMVLTDVRVLDSQSFDNYCTAEHAKLPESIRHLFNEKPTWNRTPTTFLVYTYQNHDSAGQGADFSVTFGLFEEASAWRLAVGYFPE